MSHHPERRRTEGVNITLRQYNEMRDALYADYKIKLNALELMWKTFMDNENKSELLKPSEAKEPQ